MKDDDELSVGDELPGHAPSSNQTAFEVMTRAEDVTMIVFVAFSSICILATIVGNVLVVLSIFTYRPLRGVQNYYIVSLACADLAVAIFVMPFNVADSLHGKWQFGAVFCNIWLTFDILMCTASILNLCAIAGDRFFAIHDPINYAQKRTLRRVLSVIAIVWAASAIISIPPLFGWNNSSSNSSSLYDEINGYCQLTDEPGFVLYSASGSFYIPLVIMAFLYAKIYVATRERLRKRTSSVFHPKSGRNRTGNGEDYPTPEAIQSPKTNGSIQLVKACHDRLEKVSEGVEKNSEGHGGELVERGKGVEEKNGTGKKGETEGEGKGEGTSVSCPKDSLKQFGGASIARDSSRDRPPCDTVCQHVCDSNNKNNTVDGKPNNACNGNGTLRDGNGNVGDGNETPGDGNNGVLRDGSSNKTGKVAQDTNETLTRQRGNDDADLQATSAEQKSNGAPSRKTRSRTKNSLKISSSMPRRSSRPVMTVSILPRANRTQSENWTKAETHVRQMTLRPFRWNSQQSSSSPDSVTLGGSSRLSQILENRQKISLSKERRAARTMAIVMGAFVLCWLPFFIMYVSFPFCESCRRNTDRRVKNFIVWLGYVNSALNPVIYTIFNIDFRRAFKSLLQGNCKIIA